MVGTFRFDPPVAHTSIIKALDDASDDLGIFDSTSRFAHNNEIWKMRRRGGEFTSPAVGLVTLIETADGTYLWRDGTPRPAGTARRGRRAVGGVEAGEIVTMRRFELLEPDKINASLQRLDDRLSKPRGLRQLKRIQPRKDVKANFNLVGADKGPFTGSTLLFIHGTFSNNDNLLNELVSTPEGKLLLDRCVGHYDRVLFFDHSTLAQSPIMNALDLARHMAGSVHDLDIVAHSRGGLVARWWLEAIGGGVGKSPRVILAGTPSVGTSLAAGPRLRSSMDLITNIGIALESTLGLGAMFNPFLVAPVAILRILTSLTGAVANLPVADAAVAMIPGLFGQARISNNGELRRLSAGPSVNNPTYFVVKSNFESENPGWKFWRHFRGTAILNRLADTVFDGENDLVVDCESIGDLGDGHKLAGTCDFKTSADVHHCNYFRQQACLQFIEKSFKIA